MSPKMNPNAVAFMWLFTVLMAGAIALGPLWIFIVGGLSAVYTIIAIL